MEYFLKIKLSKIYELESLHLGHIIDAQLTNVEKIMTYNEFS